MDTYIGTKIIQAEPLTLGAYNERRGWTIPDDEDPSREGYFVQYPDGYKSWSPKEVFEEAYRPDGEMNFGHALEILKSGEAVSRSGWNGKGMFLYLVPAPQEGYPAQTGVAKRFFGEGALVPYGPYIAMKTADGTVVPWLCSQTDALANDWGVVRFEGE